jgi:monofunctional biosynthetic peptidoglycan transglycosylase
MPAPRRSWLVTALRAIVGTVAAGFACLAYTWIMLPDVRSLKTRAPERTAFMRIREDEARAEGKPARTLQRWVSYRQISPTLKRAVLVTEDAAFFSHDGVDYDELKASIEASWTQGKDLRGASTITQQLAKNLYLSPSRNPYRKVTEWLITRRLEAELSKARILELYLNLVEWGDGIWGAEAAARSYFNTSAGELTPNQAALLAGSLINPRIYSPGAPNGRLLRRQQIILGRMGYVTPPDQSGANPNSPREVVASRD